MSPETVDVDDAMSPENLVYDNQNKERASWKFCNSVTLPRSEVVFFTQALILLILVGVCCGKLLFGYVPCEDKPFYTSLLPWAVGYILPNPRL